MGALNYNFTLTPHTGANADQVQAMFNAVQSIIMGGLEMGVNVQVGSPSALTGNSLTQGTSSLGVRADHQHLVRGFENLDSDPSSPFQNQIYFRTTDNALRQCIDPDAPTWITIGNLTAGDLPNHAANHKTGGVDALVSNTVDETMMAARTIYSAQPSADITLSATTWTDVITGVAPTVTGTQVLTVYLQLGYGNTSGVNSPTVGWRVLDQSSTVLWQSYIRQFGVAGGGNDTTPDGFAFPFTATTTPTLKLQAYTTANTIVIKKNATLGASTGAATIMNVVVG